MTDDELEQRLRAHYQAIDPTLAPQGLGRRVDDSFGRPSSRRAFTAPTRPALAAVIAAVLIVAVGLGLRPGGFLSPPGTSPSSFASPQPSSPSPSASPPAPTPPPPGPDVQAAGLLDVADGWALTGRRLLITADGGSTWRDVTPPGGFGSDLSNPKGVAFLDASHGWVALSEAFTSGSDPSYGRIDIWRTIDGGQTWAMAQLPEAVLNHYGEILPEVRFDFLDASHGLAFLSGNRAKGAYDSDLFWTADGGRTWSADRPTGNGQSGIEGTVGFATANDGVIVNAVPGGGIVVTHDGGRSWTDAVVSAPFGYPYGQPVFLDERSGLVTSDLQIETDTVTRVYRTLDAGSTWTTAATLPVGVHAISFLDQQRWVGFSGSEMVRTDDGGRTWATSSVAGLPGAPSSLTMSDSQHGWALVGMDVCLTFKSNCTSRTGLYATVDGGTTWVGLWPD